MRYPYILLVMMLLVAGTMAVAQDEGSAEGPKVGHPHGDMNLDCTLCHDEQSWADQDKVALFDHGTTGYPLDGAHATARCRDCHAEPVFAHVGTACVDCHQDIHRGRQGPDCEKCHDPAGWIDRARMRREHDQTALPLVGAHERADCDACHSGPVASDYVGTPTECDACHIEEYQATTAPNHDTAGFGTDCARCHGVYSSSWGSGDFVHPPSFPLTGAHGRLDCRECHEEGFTGLPTDCVACHQDDYDGTSNPDHFQTGFNTDCQACHRTNSWVPSSWDHEVLFPINSGPHREKWESCTDCHRVPSDYAQFECIFCHDHEQGEMDEKHREENGYVYLSSACYECHPRGRSGD
jgi:hypothetical protein